MIDDWVDFCVQATLETPPSFMCGCRKIIRHHTWSLPFSAFDGSLTMDHIGFTKSKMTMLNRLYVHDESIEVANELWDKRTGGKKYGSVGITHYNHFRKGRTAMGPCLQSTVLTQATGGARDIDIFYRTTELLKKFPADLVWLHESLFPRIHNTGGIGEVRFHFANVTVHPMYMVTLFPHLEKPELFMENLRESDEYLWKWVVKWTARYLCEEYFHGIEKFAQAMRTRDMALKILTEDQREWLADYCSTNHPGYSR